MKNVQFDILFSLPSMNVFYKQGHWSIRKKIADEWHDITHKSLLIAGIKREPISDKVDIEITSYYKDMRSWVDADNLAGKLVIDGLKGWVLKDDNPRYVNSVTYKSRIDKKKPRTHIIIRGIDD